MSKLKIAREALGLSQAQVSLDVGLSEGYYRRIEAGRATPSLDVLYSLMWLFDANSPTDLGFQTVTQTKVVRLD